MGSPIDCKPRGLLVAKLPRALLAERMVQGVTEDTDVDVNSY